MNRDFINCVEDLLLEIEEIKKFDEDNDEEPETFFSECTPVWTIFCC